MTNPLDFDLYDLENTSELNEIVIKNYDTLPWIEKYRPTTLDNILSHDSIRSSLKIFIQKKCLPHLLFYGPPGSGKTSMIMACVKELYGKSLPFMVKELNASDDRGIDVVRTSIKHFVMSQNSFHEQDTNIFKMVILDEADAMTSDAQAILRKIVEKYSITTRFCLICNYVQQIDPALQSRCTRFRFAPLDKKNIIKKINEIVLLEKLQITDSGINTIIRRANGDMRKILNILQSTNMAYNIINETNVNLCLGYPKKTAIDKIFDSLLNDTFLNSYNIILNIKKTYALSIADIVEALQNILTEMSLNNENTKLSTIQIAKILDKLRLVEYNIALNTIDTIQISALIGVFKLSIKN